MGEWNLQPEVEIEKHNLERQVRFQKIINIAIILLILGLLIFVGSLAFTAWYSPTTISQLEKLLLNKESSIVYPTPNPNPQTYINKDFQFTYPGIYAIQSETNESVTFSGRQLDGQRFPSALAVNFTHSLDHEMFYSCETVVFREGITSQCRDGSMVEKEINGYPYREFFLIGGKGGEEKLRQRVIQFLNPRQIQITHIVFDGVENRLDEILPTFQFNN